MPDRLTADDGNDDEEGGNGIDGTVPLPVLKCSSLKKEKTFLLSDRQTADGNDDEGGRVQ